MEDQAISTSQMALNYSSKSSVPEFGMSIAHGHGYGHLSSCNSDMVNKGAPGLDNGGKHSVAENSFPDWQTSACQASAIPAPSQTVRVMKFSTPPTAQTPHKLRRTQLRASFSSSKYPPILCPVSENQHHQHTGDPGHVQVEIDLLEQALQIDMHLKHTATSGSSSPLDVNYSGCESLAPNVPTIQEPDLFFGEVLGKGAVPPVQMDAVVEATKSHGFDDGLLWQMVGQGHNSDRELASLSGNSQGELQAPEQGFSVEDALSLDVALASILNSDSNFKGPLGNGPSMIGTDSDPVSNSDKGQQLWMSSERAEVGKKRGAEYKYNGFSSTTPIEGDPEAKRVRLDGFNSRRRLAQLQSVISDHAMVDSVAPSGQPDGLFSGISSSGASEQGEDDCEISRVELSPSAAQGSNACSLRDLRSHPDLYENLDSAMQAKVDALREKIAVMPRRKLRESLADGVTLEEVEPLMSVNRDELAGMLGLGVTTWKMFVHHTLGIPRWPARVLKSQLTREMSLRTKKSDAEQRGDIAGAAGLQTELNSLLEKRRAGRNLIRIRAQGHRRAHQT